MDTEKVKTQYRLVGLRETEFSYKEPPMDFINEYFKDGENFLKKTQAGVDVSYKWNLVQNRFVVLLHFYFRYGEETNFIELLKFSNITEFFVTELKDIFKDNGNGSFEMVESWEITFVSLSISSGRGMIASRTVGSFMGEFIFPVINPVDYILSNKIKK